MSDHERAEYTSAEGVLLIRRDGATMAIHLTSVVAILEAVVIEHPDVHLGYATLYGGTSIGHYEVEASGKADRLYVWTGADPFDRPEVEHDHQMGVECWCGHTTPRRAMLS